jgi:hypothetical protein
MAYKSRGQFTAPQCRELIGLLQASHAWDEEDKELEYNWLLAIRGWRQRVDCACYPKHLLTWGLSPSGTRREDALCATLICELALRLYELDHDQQLPATLEELVPVYLTAIPRDPYSTGPVLYRRIAGDIPTALVFCIGENGRADGGVPEHSLNPSGPDDVSISHEAE